jgi:hypothetical protein
MPNATFCSDLPRLAIDKMVPNFVTIFDIQTPSDDNARDPAFQVSVASVWGKDNNRKRLLLYA